MPSTPKIQLRDPNNDASVYPITPQNAVLDASLTDALPTYVTEYNISEHQKNHSAPPSSGRNGTNKFLLYEAVSQVPAEYQHGGLRLTFYNADGNVETHLLDSSIWNTNTTTLGPGYWNKVKTVNGDEYANKFIVNGGTSSQFMKADGTLDDSSYAYSPTKNIWGNQGLYYSPPSLIGHSRTYADLGIDVPAKDYSFPDTVLDRRYGGILKSSTVTNTDGSLFTLLDDYKKASMIAFGGTDTVGIMAAKYNEPKIAFFGGEISSTQTAPQWNMTIAGDSSKEYRLQNKIVFKQGTYRIGTYDLTNTNDIEINLDSPIASTGNVVVTGNPQYVYVLDRQRETFRTIRLTSHYSSALTICFDFIGAVVQGYKHHCLFWNNTLNAQTISFSKGTVVGQQLVKPSDISVPAGSYLLITAMITSSYLVITTSSTLS